MNRHLSDDELIDRLYGLAEADLALNAHLEACTECSARWQRVVHRRVETTGVEHIPAAMLAEQRRRILGRIEAPATSRWRWVPAMAVASLAAVALVWYPPAPAPETAKQENVDAQWLSEIYSLERAEEPRAAAPIRNLFEQQSTVEAQ